MLRQRHQEVGRHVERRQLRQRRPEPVGEGEDAHVGEVEALEPWRGPAQSLDVLLRQLVSGQGEPVQVVAEGPQHRLRQRRQLVARQVQAAHGDVTEQAVRERRQLVTTEVELAQRAAGEGQRVDRGEVVAGQTQLLQVLQLSRVETDQVRWAVLGQSGQVG